jgi:hypothetical protein
VQAVNAANGPIDCVNWTNNCLTRENGAINFVLQRWQRGGGGEGGVVGAEGIGAE